MLELYDYQQSCVDALFAFLKETKNKENNNPLIQVPTGGGKSLIQAHIIKKILSHMPMASVLCLCHATEIIKQNYDEYVSYTRNGNAGIYCGKLKRKDNTPILFSSIQSIAKSELYKNRVDILMIDEAHLCNNKMAGQYRLFIKKLKENNPALRTIGMTATPWRMDGGCLIQGDNKLFNAIVYRITIKDLIERKRLTTIVTPGLDQVSKVDYSSLKINKIKNDFTTSSASEAVLLSIDSIVPEFNHILEGRKHVLVFCPSIAVCEKVRDMLEEVGEKCALFTGKTSEKERNVLKQKLFTGEVRYLISVDALTTGFNVKNIDGLVSLRPTKSSSLWIQILGRGMRVFPNKKDCILLDYGENISRHGPVENIEAPPQKVKRSSLNGELLYVKNCPRCEMEMAMSCRSCPHCGFLYPVIERKFSKLEEGKDVLFDGSNKKPDVYNYKIISIEAMPYEKSPGSKIKIKLNTSKKPVSVIYNPSVEPDKSKLIRFFEKGFFHENPECQIEFSDRFKKISEAIKLIGSKNINEIAAMINENNSVLTPKYAGISYKENYPKVEEFIYE